MDEDIEFDSDEDSDTLYKKIERANRRKSPIRARPVEHPHKGREKDSRNQLGQIQSYDFCSLNPEHSKQFNSADIKMPHASRPLGKYEDSLLCQMQFGERLKYFADKKKNRETTLLMETIAEKEAECSFKPQVNRTTRRNLDEFLDFQQRFLKSKANKIAEHQKRQLEEETETLIFSPHINKLNKSVRKFEKRRKKSPELINSMDQKGKLKEEKKLVRNKSQGLRGFVNGKLKGEALLSMSPKMYNGVSKQQQMIVSKFKRELKQSVIQSMGENAKLIGFPALHAILQNFEMINGREETNKEELCLVKKLWDLLEGEKRKGISFANLATFILAVMNAHEATPARGADSSGQSTEKSTGRFNSEDYIITEAEAREIHTQYKIFYLNKISHKKQKEYKEEYSYKPSLTKHSAKLAERSREKRSELVKSYTDSKHDLHSILYSAKIAKEKQTQEEVKRKKDSEKKPISRKPDRDHIMSLYEQAHKVLKRDKSTEEIEFERAKDNLTFAPKLLHSPKTLATDPKSIHGGIEDSIERHRKARREKEYIEFAKFKGLHITQAEALLKRSPRSNSKPTSKRKPVLELEIRINETTLESCLIYENETAKNVLQRLCKRHKLNEDCQKQILSQLELGLKTIHK